MVFSSELDRDAWVEIDLGAVAHNFTEVRRLVRGSKVMAMVKADGYGHGAVEVSKVLMKEAVDGFGVAYLGEAQELRAEGIDLPILVLNPTPPAYFKRLFEEDLTQAVFSPSYAEALSDSALESGVEAAVHLKVDTGMGRVGVPFINAEKVLPGFFGMRGLRIEGIFTHFASADEADKGYTRIQYERFLHVTDWLRHEGYDVPLRHTANSAAILGHPDTHMDMVRPGVMLYGLHPSGSSDRSAELRPAMQLKARVSYSKKVPKGTPISYGRTYSTSEETNIATIPIGYADGLMRCLSDSGEVMIGGKRYPMVGRVCMDQFMVETGRQRVEEMDEVVIFGRQGNEVIPVEDVAVRSGTINYEVVSTIGKRVPRVYI